MTATDIPSPRPRPDGARPATPLLIDTFGRTGRDLRVSLTEKCSLRCTYCMPEEGLPPIPEAARMTTDEVIRLVTLAHHDLGVREVRFTGGEPLMRQDLERIVAGTREACPDLPVALTTNGVGLEHRVGALVEAGLDRINISLDTVDRLEFAELTRRDRLPSVLRGVRAAVEAGLAPVKVNAVPMRATLPGAPDLLEWALEEGVQLRFIEEMPLDADNTWSRVEMVTAQELLDVLGARFDLVPAGREDPSAPAELWEVAGRSVAGSPAHVGVIATVTRNFCAACDRTRLTAEGTVRSCLFSDDETDVLGVLRSGAQDAEIARVWRGAMWGKQAGHGIGGTAFHRPRRSMGAIGG
ncbi:MULTISPECIES: GTP 3',8-cyclase MoaA [Dietzia]|uniref:GTP 3',8-cyclase MoaA n=1 Tax=Dietzia cercidiphylli TaxID=498199 RepID=A0ABP4UR57_9ACTN